MARINKNNIISGKISQLVFRNIEGNQYVQSQPSDMKQTKATKLSSSEFIDCSKWTKRLRIHLNSLLAGFTDTYMYKRFTGHFYATLQSNTNLLKGERNPFNANMSGLAGFEFNTHSPFATHFLAKIAVSVDTQNQVKVVLPMLDPKTALVYPKRIGAADLVVYVLATTFDQSKPVVEAHFTTPILHNTPIEEEVTWTSPAIPNDYFIIVSAQLLFYETNTFTLKNYLNTKVLNPACILFASGS